MSYDKNLLKEITLESGITMSVYAGPEPIIPEPIVTPARAATDEVQVNFRGTGLLDPESAIARYKFPYKTYADLATAFAGAPTKTYSAVNLFSTKMNDVSGQYISVQKFISLFYPVSATGTDFATFCSDSNAVITMTSGGFTYKILGSQIMSGQRSYYPASGSSQVVEAGFVLEDNGKIRFVIGQLNAVEQNYDMFLTLADGGTVIEFEAYSSAPKFENFSAYLGAPGSIGTALSPNPTGPAYSFTSGSYLRFAIDGQNDLLNRARLYFNFNTSDTAPANPSPTTTNDICNLHAAKYTPGGKDYPDGIVLTANFYYFIIMGYGAGSQNSSLFAFRFQKK